MGRFITACSSQNAEYLMHSFSIKGWTPNSARKYKAMIAGDDDTNRLTLIPPIGVVDLCPRHARPGDTNRLTLDARILEEFLL